VETDVIICRSVDEVLSFITDIASFAKWSENTVEAVQTSPGPLAVGTTCRITSRAMGRTLDHEFQVTEYRPGERYAVRSTSGPFPMSVTYTAEQVPEGTRLHAVSEAELVGILSLAGTVMQGRAQKQFETDHVNLKRLLESASPG
jgi:hypothetical protein